MCRLSVLVVLMKEMEGCRKAFVLLLSPLITLLPFGFFWELELFSDVLKIHKNHYTVW